MFIVSISNRCNGALFIRELATHKSISNKLIIVVNRFGSPPSYRDFHTATVINDRMYIFGGRGDVHSPYHSQDEIYCPKIVYLDLKTHHWVMPTTTNKQPIGRRSHSACKYNSFTFIIYTCLRHTTSCNLVLKNREETLITCPPEKQVK